MSWYLNVPKILHVYWSATAMHYLRYLTVKSFMEQNPDWKVMLWLPKFPYKVVTWKTRELNYNATVETDYFPELLKLSIEINYVDFNDFGMGNKMSEVHKSDWLRYWMLYTYGGVYSDMDILYFAPIINLEVNKPGNDLVETFVCISPHYGHSAGFYLAAKGNLFFKEMMTLSEYVSDQYQSVGPDSMNKHFPVLESIAKINASIDIGMEAVYVYDGMHIPLIYNNGGSIFTPNSIGCHWYAGHPLAGAFLKKTDGGLRCKPNSILGKLLIKHKLK